MRWDSDNKRAGWAVLSHHGCVDGLSKFRWIIIHIRDGYLQMSCGWMSRVYLLCNLNRNGGERIQSAVVVVVVVVVLSSETHSMKWGLEERIKRRNLWIELGSPGLKPNKRSMKNSLECFVRLGDHICEVARVRSIWTPFIWTPKQWSKSTHRQRIYLFAQPWLWWHIQEWFLCPESWWLWFWQCSALYQSTSFRQQNALQSWDENQ